MRNGQLVEKPVDLFHAHSCLCTRHHTGTFISRCGRQALHFQFSTSKMKLVQVWLLLLLCFLSVKAGEETAEENQNDKETEPEIKVKTDELTEENNVLVLHDKNFARALNEYKYLLVEFCE